MFNKKEQIKLVIQWQNKTRFIPKLELNAIQTNFGINKNVNSIFYFMRNI